MRRAFVFVSAALFISCTSVKPAPDAIADSLLASSRNESLRQRTAAIRPDILVLLRDPFVDGMCLIETGLTQPQLDVYVSPAGEDHELPAIPGVQIKRIRLQKPLRPLGVQMGTSTSNTVRHFPGTLGVTVADRACPSITGYITNNHVATAVLPECYEGNAEVEEAPAPCDGTACSPSIPIGKVLRKASISPRQFTNVDAAFVASKAVEPENACGLCAATDVPADVGSLVGKSILKCGRSTGLTCGTVTGANCAVKIPYGICKEIWFVDQIRVESQNFARGGDSGSVAYTDDGQIVGLVFAGDDDKLAFLHPMKEVLSALNVSLILSACKTQPPCPQENAMIGGTCQ